MNTKRLFASLLIGFVLIAAAPAMAVEWTGYSWETDQYGGLFLDGIHDGVFNYGYAGTFGLGSVKHYMELATDARQIGVDGSGNPLYEYIIVQYNQHKTGYNLTQHFFGMDVDQITNLYDMSAIMGAGWEEVPMEYYARHAPGTVMDPGITPNWFAAWDPNPAQPYSFDIPDGVLDSGDALYGYYFPYPNPVTRVGDPLEGGTATEDVFTMGASGISGVDSTGWSWFQRIVSTQRLVDGELTWSLENITNRQPVIGRFFEPLALIPGDFDDDGDIDSDDIGLLCANLTGSGVPAGDPKYDLDGDGDADQADMDMLIHDLVEISGGDGTGTEYGDFDLDGDIDTTDLTILATNFGVGTTWLEGNANCDLVIDTTDLTILATNFGFVASGAVPEPATLFVMGCGAIGLLRRRRRA